MSVERGGSFGARATKQLSARHMWVVKRLIPAFTVGLIAWLTWLDFTQPPKYTRIYLGPILGVAGALGWYFQLRPVADRVMDEGDALVIQRGGIEERILLADILEVTWGGGGTRRVKLMLRKRGRLGEAVLFNTEWADWRSTGTSRIAADLEARARRARTEARA
jgi:hypothetical protein